MGYFYGYYNVCVIWSYLAALVETLVSNETCSHLRERDCALIAEPEPILVINRYNKSVVGGIYIT